jgi:hypothetical protein
MAVQKAEPFMGPDHRKKGNQLPNKMPIFELLENSRLSTPENVSCTPWDPECSFLFYNAFLLPNNCGDVSESHT